MFDTHHHGAQFGRVCRNTRHQDAARGPCGGAWIPSKGWTTIGAIYLVEVVACETIPTCMHRSKSDFEVEYYTWMRWPSHLNKLTWLVLGGDPTAHSHRVEQLTAL